MSKFAAKAAFLLVISLFVFTLAARQALAATVVSPANMNGWTIANVNTGQATFVNGPATAPMGSGSLRLYSGAQGNSSAAIHIASYAGVKLADLTRIDYSTYGVSGTVRYPKILVDVTTELGSDQLSFSPENQSTTLTPDTWQNWSALGGSWRSANFAGFSGGSIAQYVSFIGGFSTQDILIINRGDGTGGVRMDIGPGSTPDVFDGNVDNFVIGISDADTTFDFEPTVVTNTYGRQFFSDNNFANPVGTPTNGLTNPFKNSWGMGSPEAGVPVDNFSARWEGTFDFEAAKYRFVGTSDNIFKIYVDGELVVNRLTRGADQGAKNMTAGIHTVKVDYVHGTGNSSIMTAFWKASTCFDMTGDSKINSADQLALAQHFAFSGFSPWDLNGDNTVNSGDQLLMAQDFGKTCPHD